MIGRCGPRYNPEHSLLYIGEAQAKRERGGNLPHAQKAEQSWGPCARSEAPPRFARLQAEARVPARKSAHWRITSCTLPQADALPPSHQTFSVFGQGEREQSKSNRRHGCSYLSRLHVPTWILLTLEIISRDCLLSSYHLENSHPLTVTSTHKLATEINQIYLLHLHSTQRIYCATTGSREQCSENRMLME